jgi:hypothetical protein
LCKKDRLSFMISIDDYLNKCIFLTLILLFISIFYIIGGLSILILYLVISNIEIQINIPLH